MKTEEIVSEVAEAPAKALDKAIAESKHASRAIFSKKPLERAENYWHSLGPGLTTGASDDDPAGIATYSQTGALYGFQLLWLALFTFPLMSVVQEMCARIGMATGRGLAKNIRTEYSRRVLYGLTALLFIANTFNLGADLGAMAKSAQMIYPGTPFVLAIIFFTIVSLGLQIFISYSRYARYLKYLSFVLLLYVATAFVIPNLNWNEIWHNTLIPHITFSRDALLLICAILGTTISPYLFFWQTSQEVEDRHMAVTDPTVSVQARARLRHHNLDRKEVKKMRTDVWLGMFFSNAVMFFIIVTCGATLFPAGIVVNSAEAAAAALRPIAGQQAYLLFALGIIGTGMLAVPVLAGSAAYALAETFGWKAGLYRKLSHAYGFYGVIIISMVLGLLLNFVGLNPIKALIYSAVLNGLIAPIILFFVVRISSNKELMGKWTNKKITTAIGWVVVALMVVAGLAAIISLLI
ncbi:MAG TPA: divalent metal cation transporter [Patescibacteria group bacterium]|jgi:NRAMP (natural resistance-associated macrophage protein)-like metal ion transporter|nr:divalent metal cation transporter [Patescibacteria group bacterium]